MKTDFYQKTHAQRARRREDETLRIVKVALSCFLEYGFDQVTAEDIADASNISRRTFFRYFPSKDDVLVMLHRRSMRRVSAAFLKRPIEEPFVDAICNANRFVAEAEIDPDEIVLQDLSTRLLSRYPSTWERMIRVVGRDIELELQAAIAIRLAQQGRNAGSAGLLAAVAWSVGCSVFRDWLSSQTPGSLPDLVDAAFDQVREALD